MNFTAKIFLVIAALFALASIILGTLAAHMPNENFQAAMHWFETGMQYRQFRSLAPVPGVLTSSRRA